MQGQTERRHLEKYAAAELPPTPPHPSLFVRLPDKEGRAGRVGSWMMTWEQTYHNDFEEKTRVVFFDV